MVSNKEHKQNNERVELNKTAEPLNTKATEKDTGL